MMKSLCLSLGCAALALPAWAETSDFAGENFDSLYSSAPTLTLQGASTSKKTSTKKSSSAAKNAVQKNKKKASTPVVENLIKKGTVGIKASLNFPWLSTDDDNNDWGTNFGFQLGASYDGALFGPVGYRIEGLYSRKGGSLTGNAKNMFHQTQDIDVTLSFIEVPLMLTVRYQVIPRVTVYGGFGAYLAYQMSNETTVGGKVKKAYSWTDDGGNDHSKKYNDAWKWFDYGFNFTLGAWFPLTKTMMASAELRYVHGVANLDDHDETKTDSDYDLSNRNFLLSVGVHF